VRRAALSGVSVLHAARLDRELSASALAERSGVSRAMIGKIERGEAQPTAATGGPLELVEVELPAGAHVSFPADTYTFIHQQIWMIEGRLRFREGDTEHELHAGDCLQLGPPAPCTFINPTRETCRYLVALTRRHA
jgi:transcriptional regulator with XRE-family HTH domain